MRLLAELLLFPITGPVRGLEFVVKQIQAELEATILDESRVEAALVNLSLQHDLGEISGSEYETQEEELLDELDQIRAYKEALLEEDPYAELYDEDEGW